MKGLRECEDFGVLVGERHGQRGPDNQSAKGGEL